MADRSSACSEWKNLTVGQQHSYLSKATASTEPEPSEPAPSAINIDAGWDDQIGTPEFCVDPDNIECMLCIRSSFSNKGGVCKRYRHIKEEVILLTFKIVHFIILLYDFHNIDI